MTRKCEEKQAIYISQLSSKLQKLQEIYKYKNEPITYEDALELTYEDAENTIQRLEKQIDFFEMKSVNYGMLKRDAEMREFYKVNYIENYKTITNIKVDMNDNNKAYLTTNTEEEIIIEGHIITGDWTDNYGSLYNLVKKAIDHNIRVNIFKCNEYTCLFLEADDKTKERNRQLSSILNRIMDISENKLPALKTKKGYPDIDILIRVLRLVKIRDIKFYEELKEFFENRNNVQELITMMILGQKKSLGFVKGSDEVTLI